MCGQFKRYLVFYGERGGWDDYFGEFDTLNKAIMAVPDAVGHSDYQIVDTLTKQHVPEEDYAIQRCEDIIYGPFERPRMLDFIFYPRAQRDVIEFNGLRTAEFAVAYAPVVPLVNLKVPE